MPTLHVNGTELYYEDSGGPGEPIVFSHGLLGSAAMYERQVAALSPHYCIAYDHRGQGRSADSPLRSIDIDLLYEDAVALIGALELAPCHFVGLSLGGFVALRLATRRPDLLRSLSLLDTSADAEPPENISKYQRLNLVARLFGLGLPAPKVMPILFGRTFLDDPARAELRADWKRRLIANRRSIWRAVNGVIERHSVYPDLRAVSVPTLVLVGEEDVATTPAKAERLHAAIRGSRLVRLPRAGHTSTVEAPEAVSAALASFLGDVKSGRPAASP